MPVSSQHPSDREASGVSEPGLERTGKRFGHSAVWFLAIALVLAIPGIVLLVIDSGWTLAFGAVFLALAALPAMVGCGLGVSSLIARWSARRRSFA
jgi:hypothetical protein